jgi:outer membrane protein OmpA-like peptidoglycan-associated protein
LTLAVTDGVLEASGVAPIGWIVVASERALLIDGLDGVDFGAVAASELLEAKALVETIGGRAVLFERGTSEYREDPSALLERSAGDILALAELARLLGRPLIVHTTGHTDAAGDAATNAELRRARAESVRADLVRYGVPEALIEVHDAGDADDLSQAGEDPTLRRTEIRPVIDLSRWQYTAAP